MTAGLEFTGDVSRRLSATTGAALPQQQLPERYAALCPECTLPQATRRAGGGMLGASTQSFRFNLGLHRMSVQAFWHWNYSNVDSSRESFYALSEFVDDFNAAVNSPTVQWAQGLTPIKWYVFSGTQGLLIFGAILSGVAWLALIAAVYEMPYVATWKHTSLAIRVASLAASFFTLVG